MAAKPAKKAIKGKTKSDGTRSVPYVPKVVPAGRIVVHNHVRPQPVVGLRGFRVWLATRSKRYE